MNRRELLGAGVLGAAALAAPPSAKPAAVPRFAHEGKSIRELQALMTKGALTSEVLCAQYLARIDTLNLKGPELRALIETNRQALEIAKALDAERKAKGPRGPLHGIPVVIKDNIDTGDYQQTTAGSWALYGTMTRRDAFVVKRLREAGAVILAKANLSEWANIRSSRATSGWSARGGQCKNPYVLDRSPLGSSSGSAAAVAADLCTVAVGTETDGSLTAPASAQGLVGLKPTVGRLSRAGLIPISERQDTAGPLARSVEDAALLFLAMAGEDKEDQRTLGTAAHQVDLAKALDPKGLEGVRIGVARNQFGKVPPALEVAEQAFADQKRLGAELVDVDGVPTSHELLRPELRLLLAELVAGMDAYLAARIGSGTGPRTFKELVEWNQRHAEKELRFFGQDLFEEALTVPPVGSKGYLQDRAELLERTRTKGLDLVLEKHRLEAIVAPTIDPPWVIDPLYGDPTCASATSAPAVAGYPSLTVPMGHVWGLPVGLLFTGPAWSEATLFKLAFAYEQGTKRRKPPSFLPTLGAAAFHLPGAEPAGE